MEIKKYMQKYDFENLYFCQDNQSKLFAIIAIHNTSLGPALGGTRVWNYSSEDEAIYDALRLARGMSYKAAVAGLNLGGGKGVIYADPDKDKSEELFRAYGRFIERLNGNYITAEDVCTTPEDMDYINKETRWVVGTSDKAGDPSPYTARGVYQGIKAALEFKFGDKSLEGRVIAVQGTGHVGSYLCAFLAKEGAKLLVSDIKEDKCNLICAEHGAQYIPEDKIHAQPCDVFAPCALGAVINDQSIEQLQCSIIAGGANNVLAEERHGDILKEKHILYVPDYVINAGGLISVAEQFSGHDPDRVQAKVDRIYNTCLEVLQKAKEEDIPTYRAADRIAEARIAAGKK